MTVERVGVVGAGTMGGGIAQIAALGGYETHLYDLDGKALGHGVEQIRTGLLRGVERGRWSEQEAVAALERLHSDTIIEVLRNCELVIEAAPEELELKRTLFGLLSTTCGEDAILATNTSSLSVTAIASSVPRPERVIGMHFFNPPAAMLLVEIVAGEESGETALEQAVEAARRIGRTPIRARDGIGFVANRCARPFTLEALRMLGEGLASHEQIDRICRLGGGFRMGPFELIDLIGVDVNFAVAKSFYEQSFGEPRWRPHPIQARMVASDRLGRKRGRGFYSYHQDGPHRERDPDVEAERPILEADELERIAGAAAPAVLERISAQIVNEACFALGEEVASAADIDTAMRLGVNYPLGPLEWGETAGWPWVEGVLAALAGAEDPRRYRVPDAVRWRAAEAKDAHG